MLLLKSYTSVDRSIVPQAREQGSYLSKTSMPLLSLRIRVLHPNTRIYVRLLGPCFKTGQWEPFCQHPESAESLTYSVHHGYPDPAHFCPKILPQRQASATPCGRIFICL